MFYAGTLGYYAQLIAMGHIAALTQHANASLSNNRGQTTVLMLDPEGNTGAYKISGGANGGWKGILGVFLVFVSGVGGLLDGFAGAAGESEPFFNAINPAS